MKGAYIFFLAFTLLLAGNALAGSLECTMAQKIQFNNFPDLPVIAKTVAPGTILHLTFATDTAYECFERAVKLAEDNKNWAKPQVNADTSTGFYIAWESRQDGALLAKGYVNKNTRNNLPQLNPYVISSFKGDRRYWDDSGKLIDNQ